MIRPGHVELFVSDTVAATVFYGDILGFEVTVPPASPGDFAWVQLGNLEILLRPGAPPAAAPSYQEASGALVLFTSDVDETAALWRKRGLAFRGDDGPDCLTFTDPDGHWFQLANPDA